MGLACRAAPAPIDRPTVGETETNVGAIRPRRAADPRQRRGLHRHRYRASPPYPRTGSLPFPTDTFATGSRVSTLAGGVRSANGDRSATEIVPSQASVARADRPKDAQDVVFRVQIVSDIHLDVATYTPRIAPDVDVILAAGDIWTGPDRPMEWLWRAYGGAGVPVYAVLGNHEFYGHHWNDVVARARLRARIGPEGEGSMVTLLEDDVAYVRKGDTHLRICACTLWTDLLVHGLRERETARQWADSLMNDYVRIRGDGAPLRADDTVARHVRSRHWLDERLAEPHDGPTVVLTHHAPHPRSLDPRFRHDGTDPFFASDLSETIARHGPDVWVHGHVHRSLDYRVGRTRIVANPRGYPGERTGHDPVRVIEIPGGSTR